MLQPAEAQPATRPRRFTARGQLLQSINHKNDWIFPRFTHCSRPRCRQTQYGYQPVHAKCRMRRYEMLEFIFKKLRLPWQCRFCNKTNQHSPLRLPSRKCMELTMKAYAVNVPAGKVSVIDFCYDSRYPLAFAYANSQTANGYDSLTLNSTTSGGDACMSPSSLNKTSSYGWTPDVDPANVTTAKRRCTQRVYPTGSKCYAQNTTVFVWVNTKWPNATLENGTAIPESWFQTQGHILNATVYADSYPCGTTSGSVSPGGGLKTTTAAPTQTRTVSPTGVVTSSRPSGAIRLASNVIVLLNVVFMALLL